MSETESTIRVVIRTRPTQHFAQKNININTLENRISVTIQEEVFECCVSDIIKTSVK